MNRTIRSRPVNARASRSAIKVASVPDEVNRTRSAAGTSRMMARDQAISAAWLAPNCVPRCTAAVTAAVTSGWQWPRMSAPCPPKKST